MSCEELSLSSSKDAEKLQEVSGSGKARLKTDLARDKASKEMIHNRYKDLALVEWVFRISKAAQLEIHPVNVRLESRARGHAFVVMMAYQIVKELTVLWRLLDLTVQAALSELDALCSTQVSIAVG